MNALRVLWGTVWARMAIGATKWPCAPPAKRSSGTRAAAIPGVRMAKLFGSAAYAILNELSYYYHYNLRN
eukprot:4908022-Pleurochrysis_carterae.AAC.1